MAIFVIWLALALIVGVLAGSWGRSGIRWFFLAIILSPFLTILVLLAAGRPAVRVEQVDDGDSKTCPWCAETVKVQAKICKHCGKDLEPIKALSPASH